MDNRYYEINVPNPNMIKIYDIVVGSATSQKLSLDGTKMIIKLPLADETNHGILNSATELTRDQAVAKVQSAEYSKL